MMGISCTGMLVINPRQIYKRPQDAALKRKFIICDAAALVHAPAAALQCKHALLQAAHAGGVQLHLRPHPASVAVIAPGTKKENHSRVEQPQHIEGSMRSRPR
jgi:hypothetical protein